MNLLTKSFFSKLPVKDEIFSIDGPDLKSLINSYKNLFVPSTDGT